MNDLLGLLLPAMLVVWTLAVHQFRSRKEPASLRLSAAIALILLCAALTACTEILSLFHAITFWPILIFWVLAILAAVPFLRGARAGLMPRLRRFNPQNQTEWILASMTLAVLLLMFVCGRLFPPQTYDTLTYHLPRQVIWWQQAGVQHFDSGKYRNLSMPPLTEFVGLHLMVLTQNDFWHTSVQWLFTLVGIGAVSRLVRQAGGPRHAQWTAALFIITFPAAYLEVSSAKNDLVLGTFMIIFLALVLMPREVIGTMWHVILLGLSLGLAVLTKGTAYIFMLPLVLWCFWRIIRTRHFKATLSISMILLIAAAINAGHSIRNYQTFGGALDRSRSEADIVMINESHTPARMISVISRNIVSLSMTPFDAVNQEMENAVKSLHQMINLPIDDPATSYEPFMLTASRFFKEERAASIIHNGVTLGGIVMILLFVKRSGRLPVGMALCILIGFLTFSAYMKWQPWHVRLLLPLLFLAGPVAALAMPKRKIISEPGYLVLGVMMIFSLAPFLFAGPRPLFTAESWTKSREAMRDPMDKMRIIEGARVFGQIIDTQPAIKRVGFMNFDVDECDYVMMKALLDYSQRKPAFCYVNPLVKVPGYPAGLADSVVATGSNLYLMEKETGRRFVVLAHVPPYSFYVPTSLPNLADVPLIVQGKIGGIAALNAEGLGIAVLNVESVLRGPGDVKQVQIMTYTNHFYQNHLASTAQSKTGDQGIWLLKPAPIQGLYILESGQYLLPDSEQAEMRKLIAR